MTGPSALEVGSARLAVLGSPIAHSQSPGIHAAAYRELGLDWRYTRIRCGEAGLSRFLAGRDEQWRGFSVTMPLKTEARRLALTADPVAEESGVANTLLRVLSAADGAPRWAAFNTDVGGLARAISRAGLDVDHTIVLGSGATAVSAIMAARSLGARRVRLLARNIPAMGDLMARFGSAEASETLGSAPGLWMDGTNLMSPGWVRGGIVDADPSLLEATLVISALPGPAAAGVELPAELTRIPLFDVAYDPWPSPLAERWRAAGGSAHPGIEMLVEQALLQVRIFVGGDPELPLPGEEGVLAAMRAVAAPGVGG